MRRGRHTYSRPRRDWTSNSDSRERGRPLSARRDSTYYTSSDSSLSGFTASERRRVPRRQLADDLKPNQEHEEATRIDWSQATKKTDDGSLPELFTINHLEFGRDISDKPTLTLGCMSGPEAATSSVPVKLRWLHIQRPNLSLQYLELWVANCPFIEFDLMQLALRVIKETKMRLVRPFSTGPSRVMSGVSVDAAPSGKYVGNHLKRCAAFWNTPYLVLQKRRNEVDVEKSHQKMALFQDLYDYDVGDDVGHDPIGKRLGLWAQNSMLHMSQLWCLSIGEDLIVTFSELPSEEIRGSFIKLDHRLQRPLSIRIKGDHGRKYQVIVEPDCSYVDFLRIVFSTVLGNTESWWTDKYELLDEDGRELQSDTWVSLLASRKAENQTFMLLRKHRRAAGYSPLRRRHSSRSMRYRHSISSMRREYRSSNSSPSVGTISHQIGYGVQSVTKDNQLQIEIFPNSSSSSLREISPPESPIVLGMSSHGSPLGTMDNWETYKQDSPVSQQQYKANKSDNSSTVATYGSMLYEEPHTYGSDFSGDQDPIERNMLPEPAVHWKPEGDRNASLDSVTNTGNMELHAKLEDYSNFKTRQPNSETVQNHIERATVKTVRFKSSSISRKQPHAWDAGERRTDEGRPGPARKSLTFFTQPFFTWRLRDIHGNKDIEQQKENIVLILNKLHKELSTGDFSESYSKTFECTMDDLTLRHRKYLNPTPEDISSSKPGVSQKIRVESDPYPGLKSNTTRMAEDRTPPHSGAEQSTGTTDSEQAMAKGLFAVSRQVLDSFLPRDGDSSLLACHVYKRLCGALDGIFRQIAWSSFSQLEQHGWIITVFPPLLPPSSIDRPQVTGRLFQDCAKCNSSTLYSTASQALDHLYSEHFQSLASARPKWAFDDPCFVWVQKVSTVATEVSGPNVILPMIVMLIEDLVGISEKLQQVHLLVATTSSKKKGSESSPYLIKSLVHAFREIIHLYLLTSTRLSYMNRYYSSSREKRDKHEDAYQDRMRTNLFQRRSALDRASAFLETCKPDIVLSEFQNPTRDLAPLGVSAVSPSFFAASLLISIHERRVIPDSDRGMLSVYEEFFSKLLFEANRRPRRRVFLDINALHEEMSAYQLLIENQYDALSHVKGIRYRGKSRFQSEIRFVEEQQAHLLKTVDRIKTLRNRALALKDKVKQTVEVIDEGHGAAIRVFTLVTLFFLPLSFVTGFLGMNTTDIRDSTYDQKIFWAAAIPVTAAVIGVSLLYGYQGDDIAAWASEEIRALKRRRNAQESPSEKDYADGAVENGPRFIGPIRTFTSLLTKRESGLPLWKRRKPKPKSKAGIARQKTDDSLFA